MRTRDFESTALSDEQVREIRRSRKTYADLMDEYGVSYPGLRGILSRWSRQHLPPEPQDPPRRVRCGLDNTAIKKILSLRGVMLYRHIAAQFGVSEGTVQRIMRAEKQARLAQLLEIEAA